MSKIHINPTPVNTQTLPGVLLTDPTPDKTVPPGEAEFAFAHIALFLPKDFNLSVLDGPITGNHHRLQSIRY